MSYLDVLVSVTSPAGCEDLDSFSCLHLAVLRLLEYMSTESIWEILDITPKLHFAECGVCVCCMYLLVYVFVCVEARGRLWVAFFNQFTYTVSWSSSSSVPQTRKPVSVGACLSLLPQTALQKRARSMF